MFAGLYGKWMYAWETALTNADSNRVERPLEWGFEHLGDVEGAGVPAVSQSWDTGPTESVAATNAGISPLRPSASGRDDKFGGQDAGSGGDDKFEGQDAASGGDDKSEGQDAASGRDDQFGGQGAASGRDDKFGGLRDTASGGDDGRGGVGSELQRMIALNARIVAEPHRFFDYVTPTDFRLEQHFPELYPTNVRPETLEEEREWKRRAAVGELRKEPFLRFTSALRTAYPENDTVNARWYEGAGSGGGAGEKQVLRSAQDDNLKISSDNAKRKPKQAMIVMPQWNADAFSHNALCEIFNRFGISCLRLSKPYHDVRRPAELERSDYAVSANVGRTIAACRQAVMDVRSCVDWLASQGYEQVGVLGTSLGSAYAFIAAAMDPRIRVCAFNHASTQFGDVVWTGQSTRHVKAAFEHAGLTQDEVRAMFAGVSPMSYMEQFAAAGKRRRSLVVYAPYDLTFIERYSLDVLRNFDRFGVDYVVKVLPCGHYTTGETPYKYLDGWYLGSFVYASFKRLRAEVA